MLKRVLAFAILSALLITACAPVQPAAAPAATEKPAESAAPAASDNPYLTSLNKRLGETYDTAPFKKDGPYRIALAAQGPTNSWATLFDEHARAYVAEKGTDVIAELLYADANGSADKQVPQMEDLLSQQPDAIILVPMGRAALSAPVDRAMAQGVPVILCASGVETDNFITEVGTNLFDAGAGMAEFVAKELGGKGNIVQMNGIPGVDTAEIMAQGAVAVWAKNPDIKVLDTQYGNWSTADAKKITEQWVAKYGKEINGIWSGGAQMSQGIIEAFNDAGVPVPPIGGGEYANGFLRLVKENNIKFAGWQYPNAMVRVCIDAALDTLAGKPVKRFIDFRDVIPNTGTFSSADLEAFYNPNWSDDVFGPIFLSDEKMKELGYLK